MSIFLAAYGLELKDQPMHLPPDLSEGRPSGGSMDLAYLLRLRDPNMTGVVDGAYLAARRHAVVPFVALTTIFMLLGTGGNTLVILAATTSKVRGMKSL